MAAADTQASALPELVAVYWRPRANPRRLVRTGRLWTFFMVSHTVPFIATAVLLLIVAPVTAPVSLILLAHAWVIPELYAARGANVVRAAARDRGLPEVRALLLLGDLVTDWARELYARTGLVLERGRLGTWILSERGALLVVPGARRVHCYCVKAKDAEQLPRSDRIAHLLLALREDEPGFATVANLAFCGAPWRLRRRLPKTARAALDEAVAEQAAGRTAA